MRKLAFLTLIYFTSCNTGQSTIDTQLSSSDTISQMDTTDKIPKETKNV